MSFVALSAMLLLAATPQCEVTGDWTIHVTLAQPALSADFTVSPPTVASATDEPYASLPTFNPDAGGWCKGVSLAGIRACECTQRFYLLPETLVVKSAPGADATVYERGKDYDADLEWGSVGRLEGGRIAAGAPVYMSYRYRQARLDSVVLTADGQLALREGHAKAVMPARAPLQPGDRRLANVWVRGDLTKLTANDWFPITELQFPITAKGAAPAAAEYAPKSLAKLESGEPITIMAWGDSVTEATFLPNVDRERWQEQFVRRLKARFPKANIKLINHGWGGRNMRSFRTEPTGSQYNYAETVLGPKPDLVVMEFVNDSYLDEKGVEEQYSETLADFQRIGAEWIILTPHYVRPDWMGLDRERDIDADPRPYTAAVKTFGAKHHIAVADASKYWGRLYRQGVPYTTLLMNCINHPNPYGMSLFADALMELF